MTTDYNRSVWWREVDTALFNLISSTVYYVKDEKKQYIQPFIYPVNSNSKRKVSFPTVYIRHLGEVLDYYRYDDNPQLVKLDSDTGQAIYENSAMPYTLQYQIDFLAEEQYILNDITRSWEAKIPKRFMLDVKDMSGEDRQCFTLRNVSSPVHLYKEGETRLFRLCVTLDVRVELDEGTQYIKNVVVEAPSISFNDHKG